MADEKRLICLEDAIAKIVDTPSVIAERVFNGDYGYDQNPDMLVDRQHEIIDLLMDVPTVEVVHGRWVLDKPRVKGRNATYRCTACGKLRSSYYNDVFQWEYCPCGAKMDGDGNG